MNGYPSKLASNAAGFTFYGWIILAIATLTMFFSGPGQSHTFSVFVPLIAADLGLTKTEVATAYSLATLFAAFFLSYMGKLVDRFGAQFVMICVVGILGIFCFFFGATVNLLMLSVGFMGLRFFGQGSMMLTSSTLVGQWFSARRGTAMSIMMLGFSASIAIHPILSQYLINLLGWREAWFVLGVMTWIVMIPLIFLFVVDKPEKVGLYPDGISPDVDGKNGKSSSGFTLSEAMKTQTFWLIAAGLFTPAMLVTTLFFYQVSIFEQQGLSAEFAAAMFSVSALTMVFAMPVIGRILDKTDPRFVFSASMFLLAGSLFLVGRLSSEWICFAYAICFGINTAANMTFFGFMWARYFGREHLGSIQGVGQTIGVVGASVGPIPLGIAEDFLGGFDAALNLLALMPIMVGFTLLMLSDPKRKSTI